jgi:signal transduction histidine kinase
MPGRIEEGIDTIRMMGERLRKLVFGVLYNAKERLLERERVDALKFAGGIAAAFETRIRGAAIDFNCDFDRCDGEIEIDAGLLRSALSNILENAIDACIEDEAKEHHQIDFVAIGENDHVIFRIRDNGRGIPDEEIEHLFNLFHSSKGGRGTGLGLYITEKAVVKHGGHIDVTSNPGGGTAFSVRVPRIFSGDGTF